VQIALPLPPQVISLADLEVAVDNKPSDSVSIRGAHLLWTGKLAEQPVPIKVSYSAVGKGLYALETPSSHILADFRLALTTVGSDVRMLDLSLQPTDVTRVAQHTVYKWDYKNLMFGRPVTLDVLGIAPIDRLGELRWLGPLSVAAFGLIVGLYAHAFRLQHFDRWLLLLILGTFAGAYPLMYYAQEFVPLRWAILGSAGLVLLIVTVRAWATLGGRHASLGVLAPAASVLALALVAAMQPNYQGLLLTVGAILFFVVAMLLLPRLSLDELSKSTACLAQPAGNPA
jgi:hypothetical protein